MQKFKKGDRVYAKPGTSSYEGRALSSAVVYEVLHEFSVQSCDAVVLFRPGSVGVYHVHVRDLFLAREAQAAKPTEDTFAAPVTPTPSALSTQVGGSHYKDMAIQPLEFISKNGIGFVEGTVIKYVSRWKKKNGVEDLKKARHALDYLIEQAEKAA